LRSTIIPENGARISVSRNASLICVLCASDAATCHFDVSH